MLYYDNGLNYAHNQCVTACASDEYVDSTTHTCTKCYTPMTNCLLCTAHNLCTECAPSYYIKSDRSGCVSDCYSQDSLRYGNAETLVCIDVC